MKKRTLIILLIAAIVLVFLPYGTARADAHTITIKSCQRYARQHPRPTFRAAYVKCLRYRKAHTIAHTCQHPRPVVPYARVKGVKADLEQRKIITRLLNVGRKRHARYKANISIISAGTQESTMHNYPAGHSSSVGVLQLLDSWGSVKWRMVIENQANWYYDRAIPLLRRYPEIHVGELAQAVERSAYPHAYDQWVPEARRTYKTYLGICPR